MEGSGSGLSYFNGFKHNQADKVFKGESISSDGGGNPHFLGDHRGSRIFRVFLGLGQYDCICKS